MSSSGFIAEQRAAALEENTATKQLLDYLDNLIPTVNEITPTEPLVGDLDFEILKKCNFNNITAIVLPPGRITSLKNIPEGITRLSCPKNLLIDIANLPTSLTDLDLGFNGFKIFEFEKLNHLTNIVLDNNQLVSLSNIPSSLETMSCKNNALTSVDLMGAEKLRKLLVSGNHPNLVITNVPENLAEVDTAHMPLALKMDEGEDAEQIAEAEASVDYIDSLHTFFNLKNKYEEKIRELKRNTYKNAPTKVAGRKAIRSIRPQCIKCKRPVGSIFSTRGRVFSIKCGDEAEPCGLNVRFFAGTYDSLYDAYTVMKELVETNKERIIRLKMDALFQYVDEKTAAQRFKEEFEEYNKNKVLLEEVQRTFEKRFSNPDTKEAIEKKRGEIDTTLEHVRKLLSEYLETVDEEERQHVLTELVRIQVKELTPEILNERRLKYGIMEIETKENEHNPMKLREHTLHQRKYQLSETDFTFGEPPRVVKFNL